MRPAKVVPGAVFDRLTVVEQVGVANGHRRFLCRCSCGNETVVAAPNLTGRNVRSCGCLRRERASAANTGRPGNNGNTGHRLFERAPMTLEQIAEVLGVTHQRVLQLERQAIRKCRKWCEERGLRLDDLLPGV